MANTFDGTQIVEKVMSLIDDNLTSTLSLTRKTQYGTLRDYPNIRDQSSQLPVVLVDLRDVSYEWRQLPKTYKILYRIRIVYVAEFASTDTVVKNRVTALAALFNMFAARPQLEFSGGTLTNGQVAWSLPESGQPTPEEDIFRDHGNVLAVGLDLVVEASARA